MASTRGFECGERVDGVDPGSWAGSWCRMERGGRVDGVDPNHFGESAVSTNGPGQVDGVDPSTVGRSTVSTRLIWAGRQYRRRSMGGSPVSTRALRAFERVARIDAEFCIGGSVAVMAGGSQLGRTRGHGRTERVDGVDPGSMDGLTVSAGA